MKLVHKATGVEVKLGDTVKNHRGETGEVEGWVRPTGPASEGKVGAIKTGMNIPTYMYASVWGCEWVEREDRADEDVQMMQFDAALAGRFEATVKHAKDQGWDTFVFSGHTFLTRYAEYLCEYLRLKGML
jgi:hypothetical protein